MIKVREINKSFSNKNILNNISFDISNGDSVAIIGQSGTGKSVLLKHLNGLLRPDSGNVSVDNILINDVSYNELQIIRKKMAIVNKNKGKYKGIVIDGRDIGSVVFKNAEIKIYIDTNKIIRVKRRFKELIDTSERIIYSNVLKDINLRDEKDKKRKNSPLIIPKDAIIIDNSCKLYHTKKLIKKIIINKLYN